MAPPHTNRMFCPSTLFLLGMRASGKSTLARALAERLGYAWMDTDDRVREGAGGLEVADIVRIEGWNGFRAREALALRAAAAPYTVVATGGGVVLSPSNRLFLRQSGLCVYLEASPSLLCERLRREPAPGQRPPLSDPHGAGVSHAHPADDVENVLRERDALYRKTAHYTVPADQRVEDLADMVSCLADFPVRGGERQL
ncbi:MAG: shikimate kinase AroL [Desulfovibrionaceae bacterium]|nr:shikimate kinase AroL [Desulfovibrionaceae bacterium]